MNHSKGQEPLIRITKRDSISCWRAWCIRGVAVLLALLVCGLIIIGITKLNPARVYATIAQGAVGTNKRLWVTIRDTMMLLLIGVGLAPAFKMHFWNIGAEGQVLAGGIATAACMIHLAGRVSTAVLFLLMIASSLLTGGIWGLIPAFFKSRWNTNETLFTLMMNYIAVQLTAYCVALWENPYGSNSVGIINQQTKLGWLPAVDGAPYLLHVIIVLGITILMFFYLRYTKQGYEIAVVGDSENTARYAGIPVGRVYVRTMALSGAICSLAGFLAVSGASHTISTSTAGGRGFTAIIVAWLAGFNPFVMVLISFFLVFLEKGAIEIASQYQLNDYASEMITGILLFFILGSEFFIRYKLNFRKHDSREVQ